MSIKYILHFILLFISGIVIFSCATPCRNERDISIELLDSSLYNFNIEVDLLVYLQANKSCDPEIEIKIKQLLLNDLVSMEQLKPRAEELSTPTLYSIQKLLTISKANRFSVTKHEDIYKKGSDYLLSIEKDVNQEIEKRLDIHKKPKN
jgi:hypothetical protein